MGVSIQVSEDHEGLSRGAAEQILAALAAKPDLLLCAAGGSSPARTYALLGEHHARQPATFARLRVVKLDEWGGLAADDPGSCEWQLRTTLLQPLGVAADRGFGFHGDALDTATECERIRRRLAQEGPIDLCVLGLGLNGHIAMNEPAESLRPFAHVAELSEESRRHPMLAAARRVPTHGLTLGMAEILAAREVLLLVSGAAKRLALRRFLNREITPAFPASFLWLHPNCTVRCDRGAAGEAEICS